MNLQSNFEQIPLKEYAERAYLDYSMYVVLDRALPLTVIVPTMPIAPWTSQ